MIDIFVEIVRSGGTADRFYSLSYLLSSSEMFEQKQR